MRRDRVDNLGEGWRKREWSDIGSEQERERATMREREREREREQSNRGRKHQLHNHDLREQSCSPKRGHTFHAVPRKV